LPVVSTKRCTRSRPGGFFEDALHEQTNVVLR
jgi:hypothetical protein